MPRRRPFGGEFGLIAEVFAPLSSGHPGAFGLTDDAAVIAPEPGGELVVTCDVLVAGVHFPPAEEPGLIARKLLRVNLSDLAAMGARPTVYLLGAALPAGLEEDWLRSFAAGLAEDQKTYGVALAGGDTVRTTGPLTLSLTAFGEVAKGRALRRSGAWPGDLIFVSGTIGDARLGLMAGGGDLDALGAGDREYLEQRYRLPQPRVELGPRLLGVATAAIDISDGLVADLGHICEVSEAGAVVDGESLPLSDAARAAVETDAGLMTAILTGGDDYELLFTVNSSQGGDVARLAAELGLELTEIGRIEEGRGVTVLDAAGAPMALVHEGYTHF